MSFQTRSIMLGLGLLLALPVERALAEDGPDGPPEPAAAPARAAAAAPQKAAEPQKNAESRKNAESQKPPMTVKSSGKKMTMSLAPPKPAEPAPAPQASPPKPAAPIAAAKPATSLKLAPTAAEIENERKTVPPPPPKERDPRDATPKQNPNWPTHVDHTRGPGSTAGPGTAVDRKGMMQEVSGPQQGVIRNRW